MILPPATLELLERNVIRFVAQGDSSIIEMQDVDNAIEELVFSGGPLNRTLLGAKIDESVDR